MLRKKIYLTVLVCFIGVNFITHAEGVKHINHKIVNLKNDKPTKPSLDDFLDRMGFLESSNNYRKVNTLGYLGKYQFGRSTLKTLGYGHIPTEEFVNSPKLQEKIMIKNLKFNRKVLKDHIKEYKGKCISGVTITESGLLGAAHLAGAGNVKKFLENGINPSDVYGTKLTDYLIKFSNYELNLD